MQPNPDRDRQGAVCALLGAGAILAYFLYFAFGGLKAGFSHDDLMNLYRAWWIPLPRQLRDVALFFTFSDAYRPAGSVFYRLLFDAFGFHPLPFRIACYLLLGVNLCLTYAIAARLTRSREVALTAVLLNAYHGQFLALYANTGYCYDLLCFLFYAAALLYYLRRRESGPLGWRQLAAWSVLYVLALDSKEMAVTLPVLIAAYELLYESRRDWRAVAAGAVLTAMFVLGRLTGGEGLTAMAAYRPHFGLGEYCEHGAYFLREAFYGRPLAAAGVPALLVAGAVWPGARDLRFCLAWMLAGILPVAFIPQRNLSAVYLPAAGLAIGMASVLVKASRRVPVRGRAIGLFMLTMAVLVHIHRKYGRIDFAAEGAPAREIQSIYRQIEQVRGSIPPHSRILIERDAFPDLSWDTTFLIYLATRDHSLQIRQQARLNAHPEERDGLDFNVFLSEKDGRIAVTGEPASRPPGPDTASGISRRRRPR